MKKLLITLAIFMFAITVSFSQTTVKVEQDDYFIVTKTNKLISTDADSIEAFVFDMTKVGNIYFYAIPLKFNNAIKEATSTTPYINVLLQGSNDGDVFDNIDTVNYACSVDTTFEFSETSHAIGYSFLRVYIDGADSISARLEKVTARFIY